VVERIARDLRRVVTLPDVRERLASLGAEPMSMTPSEFARFVRSEIDDSAHTARTAGIRVQ
jgi:tripartite-type tricarboxylate transporter receptor subunit TctC